MMNRLKAVALAAICGTIVAGCGGGNISGTVNFPGGSCGFSVSTNDVGRPTSSLPPGFARGPTITHRGRDGRPFTIPTYEHPLQPGDGGPREIYVEPEPGTFVPVTPDPISWSTRPTGPCAENEAITKSFTVTALDRDAFSANLRLPRAFTIPAPDTFGDMRFFVNGVPAEVIPGLEVPAGFQITIEVSSEPMLLMALQVLGGSSAKSERGTAELVQLKHRTTNGTIVSVPAWEVQGDANALVIGGVEVKW